MISALDFKISACDLKISALQGREGHQESWFYVECDLSRCGGHDDDVGEVVLHLFAHGSDYLGRVCESWKYLDSLAKFDRK